MTPKAETILIKKNFIY